LQKRRAVKLKLQEKKPPKFTLSLGSVLSRTWQAVLVLAATWQLKRLQAAPVQAASPIVFGLALGILISAYRRKWRYVYQPMVSHEGSAASGTNRPW